MDSIKELDIRNWKLYILILSTLPIYLFFYNTLALSNNEYSIYMSQWLMRSSYIPNVVTNIYIYYSCSVMFYRRSVRNFTLIRVGIDKLLNKYFKIIAIHIAFYMIFTFIVPCIFFHSYLGDIYTFLVYIVMQMVIIFIYEIIFFIIYVGNEKLKFLIIIPPCINLIYHFLIIMPLLEKGGF